MEFQFVYMIDAYRNKKEEEVPSSYTVHTPQFSKDQNVKYKNKSSQ